MFNDHWELSFSRDVCNEMGDWRSCVVNGYKAIKGNLRDTYISYGRSVYIVDLFARINYDKKYSNNLDKYLIVNIQFNTIVDLSFIKNYYTAVASNYDIADANAIIKLYSSPKYIAGDNNIFTYPPKIKLSK